MAKSKLKGGLAQHFKQILELGVSLHGLYIILMSGLASCNALTIIGNPNNTNRTIAYDHRALLINGERRFLISGSIHYPRSTPQMWPGLIGLAKEGGLDVIQTYVFWDGHEQKRGKYYFEDRYDLVRFIKLVQNAGLYVNLRIGPYVCAEWNFGGLPEWLREIPGIEFRTDNEIFKTEMQKFVTYIVAKMKLNNLYYTQGGPIILSQVENEYGMIQAAYGAAGARYAKWAGEMAVNLNTSVPWIMCKQADSPGSVIDTCNGFYCDDYTPNAFNKPKMWTENWSGWFHYWGLSRPNRPVEDVAYATARFFQKGGSFMNYYMYHGGTNFGRTSAAGVTTSYDYDAPIDEYGQARQPKWGHLKDLHAAIKLCGQALAVVNEKAIHWRPPINLDLEISIYVNSGIYNDTEEPSPYYRPLGTHCAAFIANTGLTDVTLDFFGFSYDLPAWSVSILPDCMNVVFNTAKVAAQTTLKKMEPYRMAKFVPKRHVNDSMSSVTNQESNSRTEVLKDIGSADGEHLNAPDSQPEALAWVYARDVVGTEKKGILHNGILEQINMTHDLTDYVWYTTTLLRRVNVPQFSNSSDLNQAAPETAQPASLIIETVKNIVYVFVNGKSAGGYPVWKGNHFEHPLVLQPGNNSLALLSATTGLSYAGPFYEREVGGLSGSITLSGVFNVGMIDLTAFQWTHEVGLWGEDVDLASDYDVGVWPGLSWSSDPPPAYEPLVWYKTLLDAPEGDSPVVLDMVSMGKGAAWINGHHMGRYWMMYNARYGCDEECDYRGTYTEQKCVTECELPSQRWYHVPREWLNSTGNVLVLFEETGGNVSEVSISTQVIRSVCSNISEYFPRSIQDRTSPGPTFPQLHLDCGAGYHIAMIEFASFGNPSGKCGQFAKGECHAPRSIEKVQEACQGRQLCSLSVNETLAGEDPCPHKIKSLAVQAACAPSSQR